MSTTAPRRNRFAGRLRSTPMSGRYAVAQALAVGIVLLIALPLLPFILLIVAWIRLRDRAAARTTRHDSETVPTARRPAVPVVP